MSRKKMRQEEALETLGAIDDMVKRIRDLSIQVRQAGTDDMTYVAAKRGELAALRKLVTEEDANGA